MQRLRKAKLNTAEMMKPECVKTHLRDMIILPEMVGSVVGIHNGKAYSQVSIFIDIFLIHVCISKF
jgi:small subunit ribosomal protein S15e